MRFLEPQSSETYQELYVKARWIKLLSIVIIILNTCGRIICGVLMSFCLRNPGYWTNWNNITITIYSMVGGTGLFDMYLLYRYIIGVAGSCILLKGLDYLDISELSKSIYGWLTIIHILIVFAWVTVITVMLAYDHGKDFRYAFNDPPVWEWWTIFGMACAMGVFSYVTIFLCHREHTCMRIASGYSSRDVHRRLDVILRAQRVQSEADAEAAEVARATAELIEQTLRNQRRRAEEAAARRDSFLRANARWESGSIQDGEPLPDWPEEEEELPSVRPANMF